ncbi:MAG: hypothetical protein ABI409_06000 [Ramlibacter sp.]
MDRAAALAQEAPAPAPAQVSTDAAAMPHDCTQQMARHDHGAERGTPTPMYSLSMPMSMTTGCATAPDEPAKKAKAKPGHDHSKFHKLM